jgi:hypothetical protein
VIDGEYDTQGWNRYSYVKNNPIIYKDATGHIGEGAMAAEFSFSKINFDGVKSAANSAVESAKSSVNNAVEGAKKSVSEKLQQAKSSFDNLKKNAGNVVDQASKIPIGQNFADSQKMRYDAQIKLWSGFDTNTGTVDKNQRMLGIVGTVAQPIIATAPLWGPPLAAAGGTAMSATASVLASKSTTLMLTTGSLSSALRTGLNNKTLDYLSKVPPRVLTFVKNSANAAIGTFIPSPPTNPVQALGAAGKKIIDESK